ncbi:nucleotidyl transferase AbiEii/AbiGii toxin family protein [Bradyrhizobium sp. CCGUVB1N3]|uniref:nucleotidyl transferase AbiEii/AbiGii toxin family protein n=1 Tax=Bradyrhizobium sp. CCGUVB1N3 TaxID=2949629 RepID=UPI0020B2F2DD|nr:nucleotidyl transferase AbiEii/AbiGii toxin family protein [Bradyrhizobium sp. CCGUVB1N3]MCP3477623.1 nucleotidyl transferase AbiEii/AbiGii toxin family protein [Bradyrhizobium sp. CCGUVB1N3]
MITDTEIEQKAAELDISPQNVERDYVHGWLLREIFAHQRLSNLLVLKGGNGIRKGYLPGTRYSKDLDFSCETALDEPQLHADLNEVLEAAKAGSGVQFVMDRTRVAEKQLKIPDVHALEVRVYFKGFYAEESVTLRSHLDISEFEKPYLPIQTRPLLHPYSDQIACSGSIRCQKLEELLASKLTTLLFRRKAQDLFDLFYSIVFSKDFPVSRAEVVRTFLKKSIYDAEAQQARTQLLAVPLQLFRSLWDDLVTPRASRISFDMIQGRFAALIEDLFGLLEPAMAGPTGGIRRPVSRAFAYGGSFIPGARQIIIEAGRSRTMIEAEYHGVRRLMEPYKCPTEK